MVDFLIYCVLKDSSLPNTCIYINLHIEQLWKVRCSDFRVQYIVVQGGPFNFSSNTLNYFGKMSFYRKQKTCTY